MNRRAIDRTLFLAALMLASPVWAGADIVKCLDDSGQVTLTDTPCPSGSNTVPVSSPAAPALARHDRFVLPPQKPRRDVWSRKSLPGPGMARDVATLKAARDNLRASDSAAAAMRMHRLAGLQ